MRQQAAPPSRAAFVFAKNVAITCVDRPADVLALFGILFKIQSQIGQRAAVPVLLEPCAGIRAGRMAPRTRRNTCPPRCA